MFDWFMLLFCRKHISCDTSDSSDYSVVVGYKKFNGKMYVVSEQIIPSKEGK